MSMDWKHYEKLLYQAVVERLRAFVDEHRDETFHGLFVDCNPPYGEVLVHMESEAQLFERTGSESFDSVSFEDRWDAGDWGYFEIGNFTKCFSDVETELGEDVEQYSEPFMELASRVAIRLEREFVNTIPRASKQFEVMAAEHDESAIDGQARLARIRAE